MKQDPTVRARTARAGARDHTVAGRSDHAADARSADQPCGNSDDRWDILAGDIDAAEYSRLCHDDLGVL